MAKQVDVQIPRKLANAAKAVNNAWSNGQLQEIDLSASSVEQLSTPLVAALREGVFSHPTWILGPPKRKNFARTWIAITIVTGRQQVSHPFSDGVLEIVGRLLNDGDTDRQMAGAILAGHLSELGERFLRRLEKLSQSRYAHVQIAAKSALESIKKAVNSIASTTFPNDTLSEQSRSSPAYESNNRQISDETIVNIRGMAREQLELLLSRLAGREFEAQETEKAREAVRTVNSLANLLQLQLQYSSRPVTLKCAYGSGRLSPGFQVCERSPSQKTIVTTPAFPQLTLADLRD